MHRTLANASATSARSMWGGAPTLKVSTTHEQGTRPHRLAVKHSRTSRGDVILKSHQNQIPFIEVGPEVTRQSWMRSRATSVLDQCEHSLIVSLTS